MRILAIMLAMVVWVCSAQAEVFQTSGPISVWAEEGGRVHVEGAPCDIEQYVKARQYCPDRFRGGCGNNVTVKTEKISDGHVVLTLHPDGLDLNQRAFNFKNANNFWSPIPNHNLKVGKGLVLEMSTTPRDDAGQSAEDGPAGGCHYTYVLDVPGYQPRGEGLCMAAGLAPVVAPPKAVAGGGANGSDQGAVAIASEQGASAAHNSAAGTTGAVVSNNSAQASGGNMFNISQLTNGKGKKGKGGNTNIIYAPGASQRIVSPNIKGSSADVKVYANKSGKKGSGIKNVITYVGPTFQSIHIGTGAGSYDEFACVKCHNDYAQKDEKMKKLVQKAMSSALVEEQQAVKPAAVKKPAHKKPTSAKKVPNTYD